MKKNIFLLLSTFYLSGNLFAQKINLRLISPFPSSLIETSGITTTSSEYVWTHNDGGGNAELYKVDTLGNILRTVSLQGAKNTDWEDVIYDGYANFYLGDFGNNNNNRKDLKIFIFKNPDSLSIDIIPVETIQFSYPDQKEFPAADSVKNYDTEAFIHCDSSLYIFTKNRTYPFTGFTYMYRVPDKPGIYLAEKLDSFKTGTGLKEMWWITSASISPDRKKLILLSSDKMFLFTDFTGNQFLKGKATQVQFNTFSQKEGICFINNTDFFVSDEYTSILQNGGNLYMGSLLQLETGKVQSSQKKNSKFVQYRNTEERSFFKLNPGIKIVWLSIYDLQGKVLAQTYLNNQQPEYELQLPPGTYIAKVYDGKNIQNSKFQIRFDN
ncbi:MAG: T9SS type A sorting domain-containing protein [Flavobacteriales bacterium]|nr:T9SS type A sorting domain-containing protein [Flavobacteriales bacterium]